MTFIKEFTIKGYLVTIWGCGSSTVINMSEVNMQM